MVMLGGAVAVFLGTFLAWFKVDIEGFGGGSVNGFHYFFPGHDPVAPRRRGGGGHHHQGVVPNVKLPDSPGPVTWSQAYLIACGVIAFLIPDRIISVDGPE